MFEHLTFLIDVSEYQRGLTLPDVAGVYAKCTEGQHTKDAEYQRFKDQAANDGKLFAGYHFLRSDSSPVAQAEWFMTNEPDKDIPCVIDVELSGSSKPGFPHLHQFVRTLRDNGHHAGATYYPFWWWNRTGTPDLSRLDLPLIASAYPSMTPGDPHELYRHVPDSYWNRYGGVAPSILQFTSRGRFQGYGGDVDCNAFRGRREELAATGIFHDFRKPRRHHHPAANPSRVTTPAPAHDRPDLQTQIDRLRHRVSTLEAAINHGGK